MPGEKNLKENKTKSLILSLIFPIICAVGAIVYLLVNLDNIILIEKILGVVMAVCAIFPLVSVLFLKTDISRLIKWQIISTAAAAGFLLLYFLFYSVEDQLTVAVFKKFYILVGILVFDFIVPLVIIIPCGVIYGVKLRKESGRRGLKWFTVFLSTPAVYYGIYFLAHNNIL